MHWLASAARTRHQHSNLGERGARLVARALDGTLHELEVSAAMTSLVAR